MFFASPLLMQIKGKWKKYLVCLEILSNQTTSLIFQFDKLAMRILQESQGWMAFSFILNLWWEASAQHYPPCSQSKICKDSISVLSELFFNPQGLLVFFFSLISLLRRPTFPWKSTFTQQNFSFSWKCLFLSACSNHVQVLRAEHSATNS